MSSRNKNILILGLIIGIFVAFALAGRFLIHPEDMERTNKGTLIVPHVQINALELRTEGGENWSAKEMAGQWTLLYVAGEQCDQACKNALFYLMTRLRESLGRDSERLRLAVVHTATPSAQMRAFIDEKMRQPVELQGDPARVKQALSPAFGAADADPRGHLYLAAPDGQIFMWYPTHADMEKVLREADNIYRDLTRTLKGSLIG